MSRENLEYGFDQVMGVLDYIVKNGTTVQLGVVKDSLARALDSLQSGLDSDSESLPVTAPPQITDEEVWLRVIECSRNTEYADQCVQKFRERFRKETVS